MDKVLIRNKNQKALKSGIWYTVSNFVVKSIGFITTPIFTRLLTKEEFGLYNNFISWLSIISIIVTLNLESTLISARYDYEDRFDEYIFSTLSLSSISAIIWLCIVNSFSSFFSNFLDLKLTYINAMLVYLFLLPAVNLFQARERYRFEYKKTVAISLLIAISTAGLSVILVLFLEDKITGRIIGSVLPTILVGVLLYIFFVVKGKKIKIEYWKYALPICLPYIPHLLSLSLLNSMDRVMITRWCGAEYTAIYSLAYTCGSMVTLLLTSMNNAYAPWLGEKLNSGCHNEIRDFSKIYIIGFLFLAIGIMIVAPEVLMILGGDQYIDAKYVITPIAMGCVCQFLYTMFVNVEQFKKKTVGMALASMTAALVNFVLNYIFIPKIGYLAAAYTTLAGYLCLLGIHMLLVKRLKLDDVYDYHFIIMIVILGIGITSFITLLYSKYFFRLLLFVIYIMVGYCLFRKYQKRIIKLMKRRD